MSTTAIQHRSARPEENFGGGMGLSVALHVLVLGGLVAIAWTGLLMHNWGGSEAAAGAIQASMVSSIPLPQKAVPVEKNVLAPEHVSEAPAPPPKEATQPPPKPTDIEVKARTAPAKPAAVETPTPPKHPQPTPTTPKAASGEQAAQIPEAMAQVTNGNAALSIQDQTIGQRYSYYGAIMQRIIGQNWFTQEVDPRTPPGKQVKVTFDVGADGVPTNVRVVAPSGSPTLDASAIHALQRVNGFGPNPAGRTIPVSDTFTYRP